MSLCIIFIHGAWKDLCFDIQRWRIERVSKSGERKKRPGPFYVPREGRVRLKTVAISSRWTQREQVFEGFCDVVLHDTTFLWSELSITISIACP